MKKFLYSLRADLLFSEPVSNHTFVLRSVPLSEPGQEPMRISLTCQPAAGCQKPLTDKAIKFSWAASRINIPSFLFARQEKYWSIPRSAAVSVRLPTIDIRLSLRR